MHRSAWALLLCLLPQPASAQGEAWEQRVEVRRDSAMFTIWAWITLADTASDRSTWHPAKHYVRAQLEERLEPAYRDSLRAAYARLASTRFDWHATMIALHVTAPPHMEWSPEMIALYGPGRADSAYLRYLRQLAPRFLPLVNEFHERARVDDLFARSAQWYDPAIARQRDGTLGAVRQALAYLRLDGSVLAGTDRIIIVPNLIGPPGTAMGPRFHNRLFDVETPRAADTASFTAHEYIHQMVGSLVRDERYRARIERIVRSVHAGIEQSAAAKNYPEPLMYFEESLVRTLDFTVRLGPGYGYDNDKLKQALSYQHGVGFVLVWPIRDALVGFEREEVPFDGYFERLLTAIAEQLTAPGPVG